MKDMLHIKIQKCKVFMFSMYLAFYSTPVIILNVIMHHILEMEVTNLFKVEGCLKVNK